MNKRRHDIAVKILFYARDVRGGLGERKVFRTILEYMTKHSPESVVKNIWAVPEFGRYDDLLVLLNSSVKRDVINYIKAQLDSDMEFDHCTYNADLTNFENAKRMFSKHGYILPTVVFWNVQSRNQQQPVTMNEQGVILVSGCSPRVFKMVVSGNLSPYAFMLETLCSERYEKITA